MITLELGKAWFLRVWQSIRYSYWFVPLLMLAGAIALSFLTIKIDEDLTGSRKSWIELLYKGGPSGARAILSTVAGSMITVAGVVFSVTIVSLSLASSQFGPRLLRNFMSDLGNQIVLGTFIATFLYCLLVLRVVRGEDYDIFVPHVSVLTGLMLAICSLCVLVYFIHHISTGIQASSVIARVGHDMDSVMASLFPDECEVDVREHVPPELEGEWGEVTASRDGYVQAIDCDSLVEMARKHDVIVEVGRRPGHFVMRGMWVARVFPASRSNPKIEQEIWETFLLGSQRTQTQDIEYDIFQLVEIAVRSLSTGVNDPFTAINCIDLLGGALNTLAQRQMPRSALKDKDDKLRLVRLVVTFKGLADAAFNQIRQNGAKTPAVALRLLETIYRVHDGCPSAERRACLREHGRLTYEVARESMTQPHDLAALEERAGWLEE